MKHDEYSMSDNANELYTNRNGALIHIRDFSLQIRKKILNSRLIKWLIRAYDCIHNAGIRIISYIRRNWMLLSTGVLALIMLASLCAKAGGIA